MAISRDDNAAAIFLRQAARQRFRDRPRLMVRGGDGWAAVTWGELSLRVQRLASFLMDAGVGQGVKVAVLSSTRPEWGIFGLSTLSARGVLVPVYPTLTADQMAHIIGHSDAKVLLVEDARLLRRVLGIWGQISVERVVLAEETDVGQLLQEAGLPPDEVARFCSLAEAEEAGAEALEREPDRVAERVASIPMDEVGYLIYTSGTTGPPKGVMLSHLNVASNGAAWIEVNGPLVREGDRDLLWLPMSHIFGWGEFCLGNQLGLLTYFSDPAAVLGQLSEVKPQVLMSVPAYWEKLAQSALEAVSAEEEQLAELRRLTGGELRFCLSGGAGLRREIKELFLRAGMLLVEGYGLTEASPTLTMNHHNNFDFSSVGKPLSNVELRLAEDGEILAKGPNVFCGYYKDPRATAGMFDEEGWLHTGDLGRWTAGGFLQIVDRKKDILVTLGGKNVAPQNIEMLFSKEPLISYLVVFGDGRKYLTAIVDLNEAEAARLLGEAEGLELTGEELRRHPTVLRWIDQAIARVNEHLAHFETIKAFRVATEAFSAENEILTPSLKVKRAKVAQRYRGEIDSMYNG